MLEGEIMNVIASPKMGKSWLVTDLALAVATGTPWLGYPTHRGEVLIIDNELHGQTTANRIPKVAMAHNVVVLQKGTDPAAFANASVMARDNAYIAPGFAKQVIAATPLVGNGETVEVTFTVPAAPGKYTFLCSFPGHFLAGMRGTLNVT
jgi:azurin